MSEMLLSALSSTKSTCAICNVVGFKEESNTACQQEVEKVFLL
jgi:hypothetical protein